MPKNRTHTILALSVVAVGAVVSAILGLFAYMSVTATPIHADLRHVRSVTHSVPLPQWLGAVDEGRQIVRGSLVAQNLPGVSVAVGIGGDIVWAEGFGWADLENRVPVAPETRFRIADVSIPLTSAAVGLLIEKKKLNLDDQIQTYVPDFPKKDWPVTVRQLMGHVAGVRTDAGDEEPISIHCGRPGEALQRFASDRLKFEPGTEYRRSSYGWILVSAAVEAAAKRPFFTFMRTQIFEPLGMEDTRPDSSKESPTDRVTFYHPRFAGDTRYGPELVREGDYSCLAGGSGFLSTPSDLVRFGMAISGGKLLQPATVEILQSPQRLTSGQPTDYGLGWTLATVPLAGKRTRMAGHDTRRDFLGGTASLMLFPERQIVVAVTSNIGFADTRSAALKIAQAFAEERESAASK
jgi:CubicO group peptidase (beta-lactamase class C family)